MGLGTKANETEGEGQHVEESHNWEDRCMHRLAAIYVAQTAGKTKFTNHLLPLWNQILPFTAISSLRFNDSLLLDF